MSSVLSSQESTGELTGESSGGSPAIPSEFRQPAVTVDGVVLLRRPFAPYRSECRVLLIQRRYDPFRSAWALPGGFVEYGEDLIAAVEREIAEETGLNGLLFRQFKTYGDPHRDPRGHTISVVFLTEIVGEAPPLAADDDALQARWFSVGKLPRLAFDHGQILHDVLGSCGLT